MSSNFQISVNSNEYESTETYLKVTKKVIRYCKYNKIVYFLHTHDNFNFNVTLNHTYSDYNEKQLKIILIN